MDAKTLDTIIRALDALYGEAMSHLLNDHPDWPNAMTTPTLTPRTDAAAVNAHDGLPVKRVSADFARQLERELAAAQERAEKAEAERDEATSYAKNLAEGLHRKHYAEVTQWKPLDDLLGLLTQIDNMTARLVRTLDLQEKP